MATCKDCFHEEVCNAICPKGLLPYQSGDYPAELFCLQFKNKADYAEVKHGKWIDKPTGRYLHMGSWCSICQKSGIDGTENNRHKPYCPNCGAEMGGKGSVDNGD